MKSINPNCKTKLFPFSNGCQRKTTVEYCKIKLISFPFSLFGKRFSLLSIEYQFLQTKLKNFFFLTFTFILQYFYKWTHRYIVFPLIAGLHRHPSASVPVKELHIGGKRKPVIWSTVCSKWLKLHKINLHGCT